VHGCQQPSHDPTIRPPCGVGRTHPARAPGRRRYGRPMASESMTVEVSGREVKVSSPGKVFFKTRGETKLDLIRYYQAVEGPLLATIRHRPTLMQRFPDGAHGKSFFQKRVPKGIPD